MGLALSTAQALAAPPILPGYWESTNQTSFIIEQTSTSRKCITAALAQSYLTGPSNNHYTCVYDRSVVGAGKVALAGQCVDNGGRKIHVDISGDYTKTSFDLTAQLAANLYGLPLEGTAITRAHRISDVCPVAETRPQAGTVSLQTPPPGAADR
jgi:hypothetical protein